MGTPKLTLHRTDMTGAGVFGTLMNDHYERVAVTCERPDNGNKPMGCIPAGTYSVTPYESPTKGKVLLLHDVPGRSMIEIHSGNTIKDTEGCILVGYGFGYVDGMRAVVLSRTALHNLILNYSSGFDLTIVEGRNATNYMA